MPRVYVKPWRSNPIGTEATCQKLLIKLETVKFQGMEKVTAVPGDNREAMTPASDRTDVEDHDVTVEAVAAVPEFRLALPEKPMLPVIGMA